MTPDSHDCLWRIYPGDDTIFDRSVVATYTYVSAMIRYRTELLLSLTQLYTTYHHYNLLSVALQEDKQIPSALLNKPNCE